MSDVAVIIRDKKLIAGVAGVERLESRTEAGPYKSIDQSNRFKLYQQMVALSPHVFIPILKMSLTIIKGFRIVSKNNAKKEEYDTWAKNINLRSKIQMMAMLLCRDGTYVGTITVPQPEIFDFEPAMMQYVSILPAGYDPAKGSSVVLAPPIEKFIVNEGIQDAETPLTREEVIYGALYPRMGQIEDNKGRQTYGLYGQSMLDPIEQTLWDYLDITQAYAKFIKRYGYGRYHIDYTALEEFIKEGDVESAIEALDKLSEEHATIEENEDIIGAGFKVHELNTGGSNPNITEYKESLEKDIQIGLLQAPLTMGRAEGTTFASGYISEEDRMVALEGIQNILKDIVNQEIIRRREGVEPGVPLEVGIEFEELSKPKVESKDLMEAYKAGLISAEQWRARSGFPVEQDPNGTYMQMQIQQPGSITQDAAPKQPQDDAKQQDAKQPLNNPKENQ